MLVLLLLLLLLLQQQQQPRNQRSLTQSLSRAADRLALVNSSTSLLRVRQHRTGQLLLSRGLPLVTSQQSQQRFHPHNHHHHRQPQQQQPHHQQQQVLLGLTWQGWSSSCSSALLTLHRSVGM